MAKKKIAQKKTPAKKTTSASCRSEDVFGVERIRNFADLLEEYGLSELVLESGDQKIHIRRGQGGAVAPVAPVAAPVAPAAVAAPAPAPTPAPAPSEPAAAPASGKTIDSPMVGTFYKAANPGSPAYVKVGDQVGPETVVCLVEAMKTFSEIHAETSGKITEILVEDGQAVEFGQPLFAVD